MFCSGAASCPVLGEVELHEDEVPELEEAVALAAGRAVGPVAALLGAAVVEPEQACTRPVGPACQSSPSAEGAMRSGRTPMRSQAATATASSPRPSSESPANTVAQRRSRSSRMLGDELPGEFGGAVLEVLPHGEVAQHLEEREARSEADLVDVRRPEALLDGGEELGRGSSEPEEVRLQRLHARRDCEHGRVVVAGTSDAEGRRR